MVQTHPVESTSSTNAGIEPKWYRHPQEGVQADNDDVEAVEVSTEPFLLFDRMGEWRNALVQDGCINKHGDGKQPLFALKAGERFTHTLWFSCAVNPVFIHAIGKRKVGDEFDHTVDDDAADGEEAH